MVFFKLKHKLLSERLVRVRCEHDVDGRALARQQSALERPDLEELDFLLFVCVCSGICLLLRGRWVDEPPFASHLFLIFNSELNCFASIDKHFLEIQVVCRHSKLGNRQVCDEVDHIGGSILHLDGHKEVRATKFTILTGCEHYCEQLRVIWHNLLAFVLINCNSGLTQQFFVKGKVDGHFSTISESERPLFAAAHNNITKIADVGANLDVVKVD